MSSTTTAADVEIVTVSAHQGAKGIYLLGHATTSCALAAEGATIALTDLDADDAWPCAQCIVSSRQGASISAHAGVNVDAPEGRGGASRPSAAQGPSEAQERFIRSLWADLGHDADERIAAVKRDTNLWTRKGASTIIDGLKASLEAKRAAERTSPAPSGNVRANRFAGRCADCGTNVAEGAGRLEGRPGAWITRHLDGECPVAPAVVTASDAGAATRIVEDGIYRTPDGTIYKVQVAVHGSGNLYAKRLVLLPEDEWYTKTVRGKEVEVRAEFVFARGALRNITPADRLSLEEAKEFGHLYGVCCRCGATLTDDSPGGSIEQGIGPVCAGKF